MKSRYWISGKIVLMIVISQSFSLMAQERIALLMGVGDYPASSNWPATNAYNDINLIKETLIQQGMNSDSIYTFLDSACTKKGIENAMSSFIIPKLKEGMFLYIHFSGLARHVAESSNPDYNTSNIALIPYDAPDMKGKLLINTQAFISSDDLSRFLHQMQKQIGAKGQIFISIDASIAPENKFNKIASRGSDEIMGASASEISNDFFSVLVSKKELAPVISFYSSNMDQEYDEYLTEDNESYGLFSYSLCKSIFQMKKHSSYKDWFDRLKMVMEENSSHQKPMMTGDESAILFNGLYAGKKDHFNIKKTYNDNLVLINAGKLDQLEKGTEFLIYKESVKDTAGAKPIAKGVVEDVKLTESDLRILESSIHPVPHSASLFVSSYHYLPLMIRVKVDLGGSELESKLMTHFSFSPFIKKDFIKPELLVVKTKTDFIQLKTSLGDIIYQQPCKEINQTELPFILNEKIAEYLRANFLRNFELDNNNKKSTIEALWIRDGKEIPVDRNKNKLAVGTRMKLRIHNNTGKKQYFNVIDIQPDQQINVLIPFDKRAEEYSIGPGETYTTEFELNISPPLGKDVLKVIMMSTPLDLRPVIATRGVSNLLDTKKAKNPFEIFLGHTFIEHPVTAGKDLKIDTSELSSVFGMNIEIVEDK